MEKFCAQKVENVSENQLPVAFYPVEDTTRQFDLDTGKTTLVSNKLYIPQKVQVPCQEDISQNCNRDSLELSRKKVGMVPGVKVDFEKHKQDLQSKLGSSRVTSEEDAPFGILTVDLFDETYFYPQVNPAKWDEEHLDFYLIPKKGTRIDLRNSDGAKLANIGNAIMNLTSGAEKTKHSKNVCPAFEVKDNSFIATPNLSMSCVRQELRGRYGKVSLAEFIEGFRETNPNAKYVDEKVMENGLLLEEKYTLPNF
ncbi:MAG: hypothetical protein WDZ77_01220 [Candidatus Pacearchaeota archaeon]